MNNEKNTLAEIGNKNPFTVSQKINLIFAKIILVFALAFIVGCSEYDEPLADPEGTISIYMTKDQIIDGAIYQGLWVSFAADCMLYITYNDNFYCGPSYNSSMVSVGKVRKLSEIRKIPNNGYTKTPAVQSECGYVLSCGDGTYARIYVASYNGVGANIKYQYPFIP